MIRKSIFVLLKTLYRHKVVLLVMLVLSILILQENSACAQSGAYILEEDKRVPIPEVYEIKYVIFNAGDMGGESGWLNKAEDLYINSEGYLFVADTGNNRIVKMRKDGELVDIFKGPAEKPLNEPRGVYADDKGNMYIADKGNSRILHLSSDGTFVEEFIKPESKLLWEDFIYRPSKVFVSPNGYLYSLIGRSIMIQDAYNNFRGFLGQANVGFSLVDVILRRFASAEQKRYIQKRVPANYTDFTLGENGIIYAASLDLSEGNIKKLNSIGKNIYKKSEYGEMTDDEDQPITPVFTGITVDKNGIITVIEETTGKLYQYDDEGNLLAVFGGKDYDTKGKFVNPTAIVADNEGNLYVLDGYLNNIQVFEPTRFIKLVHEAVKLYSGGEYEKAHEVWQEVLKIDANYKIANNGIAKTLYKQKQWKASMEEYIRAGNKEGYSQAFSKYRHQIFRQHFGFVILGLAAILALLYFFVKTLKRTACCAISELKKDTASKMGTVNALKLSLAMLFHPVDTLERIKKTRDNPNYLPSFIILLTVIATRVFFIYTAHYALSNIDPKDANIWLEVVKYLLPVLTWVVASFAITSISGGEAKINEIFIASSYCMLPYIVINIPLALLSNLMSKDEAMLYSLIIIISWIWVFVLFFLGLQKLNDYTVKKTVAVSAVSIAMMGLIWAMLILMYTLSLQLHEFITGIIREIRMKLL